MMYRLAAGSHRRKQLSMGQIDAHSIQMKTMMAYVITVKTETERWTAAEMNMASAERTQCDHEQMNHGYCHRNQR